VDYIVISGMGEWDGRYEFDVPTFDPTVREWGWIKTLAGYMPLTLDDGIAGGDPALITVLALIAMRRSGTLRTEDVQRAHDRFQDAPFGASIQLDLGPETEDVEDPSQVFPETSSSENGSTNGEPGLTNSETSAAPLPPIGTHGWGTSESA
jgi:hypothetical protein